MRDSNPRCRIQSPEPYHLANSQYFSTRAGDNIENPRPRKSKSLFHVRFRLELTLQYQSPNGPRRRHQHRSRYHPRDLAQLGLSADYCLEFQKFRLPRIRVGQIPRRFEILKIQFHLGFGTQDFRDWRRFGQKERRLHRLHEPCRGVGYLFHDGCRFGQYRSRGLVR